MDVRICAGCMRRMPGEHHLLCKFNHGEMVEHVMEFEEIVDLMQQELAPHQRINYIPLAEVNARAEDFNRTVRGFTSEDFISSCLSHK